MVNSWVNFTLTLLAKSEELTNMCLQHRAVNGLPGRASESEVFRCLEQLAITTGTFTVVVQKYYPHFKQAFSRFAPHTRVGAYLTRHYPDYVIATCRSLVQSINASPVN
jgi:hypothetical protein